MAKQRKVYMDDERRYYKINLPLYVGIDMLKDLVRLSGLSEARVTNILLSKFAQYGELGFGAGAVEEDQLFIFVENGEIITESGDDKYDYSPDEGKMWSLADNLQSGK